MPRSWSFTQFFLDDIKHVSIDNWLMTVLDIVFREGFVLNFLFRSEILNIEFLR